MHTLKSLLLACLSLLFATSVAADDHHSLKQANAVTYPAGNPDQYQAPEDWTLVWADEFAGDILNEENWTRQVPNQIFNEEWQIYTDDPANSYVQDGYLVLKAIHTGNQHADRQYTSARLHTAHKQIFKYGRIAARIQLPYGQGMWPAFWMLGASIDENGGDTPWPASGEIDILELYGSRHDNVVEANIHYDNDGHEAGGAVPYKLAAGKFADNFHIFELVWTETEFTWLVDGNAYSTVDITPAYRDEFHQEFFLLLNIAVGGKYAGSPDASSPFPAQMLVDWVRVYQQH